MAWIGLRSRVLRRTVACMRIPVMILAGGRATRMGGGDKPLLPLAGGTILSHVVDRLAPQSDALALNANGDPGRFAAFGLPVRPDSRPGCPLGGRILPNCPARKQV